MEFEDRNPKPEQPNGSTPTAVLAILIVLVCVLLYVGWQMMSDESSSSSELAAEEIVVPKTTDSIVVDEDDTQNIKVDTPTKEEEKTDEKQNENVVPEVKSEEKTVEKATAPVVGETAKHTVKSGETFYGIANKFNVSGNTLKKLNPGVDPEGIKVGVTKLIVPVQAVHTVGPGDILRVVAKKYGITLEQLMAANGKTKNFAERGEKLLIPNKNKE